jgi:hypothetical protein
VDPDCAGGPVVARDRAEITGPLADPTRAIVQIRARVTQLVATDASTIYQEADSRWPIRTGRSKAALFSRDESGGALVVFRLGCGVDYARFIKSLKVGKKSAGEWRHVLTRELGDPVRAARRTLGPRAAEIAAEVLTDL